MKVSVEKDCYGKWGIRFGFGVQSFFMPVDGNKDDALWYARMLRKCFKAYKESLLNKK